MSSLHSFASLGHNVIRASSAGAIPILLDLFMALHRSDEDGHLVEQQLIIVSVLQMVTELSKSNARRYIQDPTQMSFFGKVFAKLVMSPNVEMTSLPFL